MIPLEYFWTVVALMMVGTITIRFSLIAFSSRMQVTHRVKEIFSFIPASILPALIAPAVFFHHGKSEMMSGHERLVVLVSAGVVCWFLRSTLATVVFGLVFLWFLSN